MRHASPNHALQRTAAGRQLRSSLRDPDAVYRDCHRRVLVRVRKDPPSDTDMKTSRNLGLVAIAVFVISHFLPAYGDASGFACFRFCLGMLFGHDAKILSGGWFYYSGLAISDILFIG